MKFGSDLLMFPVYLVVLGMIVLFVGNVWELAIILLLMMAITVLHKIFADRDMEEAKRGRDKLVDLITEKLDVFSGSIEHVRSDIAGHYKQFDERTSVIERNYMSLTERVIDVENRIHGVNKTLGAAVGLMEERIRED